jgi:hypothetical protein
MTEPEKIGFRADKDDEGRVIISLVGEVWPDECLIHTSIPGRVKGPDDMPILWTLPDGLIAIKLTSTEAVYRVKGRAIQDADIMVCERVRLEI